MAQTQNGLPSREADPTMCGRNAIIPGPSTVGKSVEDALHLLADQFNGVTWDRSGRKFMALCPVHGDKTASLSVTAETSRDRKPLGVNCFAGCSTDEVLGHIGYTWAELYTAAGLGTGGAPGDSEAWMPCGIGKPGQPHDWRHRAVATYPYRDEHGALVFAVARCALKGDGCQGFRQWRPDPTTRSGKRWSLTVNKGQADEHTIGDGLPYRLAEARMAMRGVLTPNLWVVEGEKDADRLRGLGYTATCNAGGAGKWTQAHADHFRALRPDVVIVADCDDAGWKHAEHVSRTFVGLARSVEVRRAAVKRKGADLSDHLDAGFKAHQLVTVATPLPDPGIADIEEWAR